jgi:D-glycero-alpha-D-manno-heptose-7-phosphate kinase
MGINKYIYVSINKKFDGRTRLSYSRTENVNKIDNLRHDLVRVCLKFFDLKGIEITIVSDIPGEGSGLGSSSSLAVGLMNAISAYCDRPYSSPHLLAELAFTLEVGCGHFCGKQDHYAAAYGGLHFYEFMQNGSVSVEPICFLGAEKHLFEQQFMLFWTGRTRKAKHILEDQTRNIKDSTETVAMGLKKLAYQLRNSLIFGEHETGCYLNDNWELKKNLANGISDAWINKVYAEAKSAGAIGGKICGAGGGGFLLLSVPCENKYPVKEKMEQMGLKQVPFHMSKSGSEIVYAEKNSILG